MTDTDQLAIVTLIDARDTTLTRVWASRDENDGFVFPLCATREAAKAYAEARERALYAEYENEPDTRILTWTPGPTRMNDNENPVMHDIEYLCDDGDQTCTFVFSMVVHPDAASAQTECAIRADVEVVEANWDRVLDDKEN